MHACTVFFHACTKRFGPTELSVHVPMLIVHGCEMKLAVPIFSVHAAMFNIAGRMFSFHG